MKKIPALIGLFALLEVCCQFPGDLAGGSASEGEACVVGRAVGENGDFVADALVRVRPAGYLKDTTGSYFPEPGGRVRDLWTSEDGTFIIDSLETGAYAIEIIDRRSYSALIRCYVSGDTTLGSATLRPSGTIAGSIDPFSANSRYRYVQVYDLDRSSLIDSLTGAFTVGDVPQGVYSLRLLPASPDLRARTFDSVGVVAGVATAVQTGDWAWAGRIYLNTTPLGAGVNDNAYGFPVLIRLTANNFNFGRAKISGDDIRFAKKDGAPLPFEIERWDASLKTAEIWVKIDTVIGNNNMQYFRMFWGNPDAPSASNGAAVFDTAAGFQGVLHFASSAGGTCRDATYNGHHGTLSAVVPVQGIIGGACSFDGSSSFIALENTAAGPLNFPQNGRYAISAWVKLGDSTPDERNIVSKGYAQYALRAGRGQWQFVEHENRVALECETSRTPVTFGDWVYLCAVRDGAKQYLYVNGSCADSTIDFVQGIGVRLETFGVEIGRTVFPDSTPVNYFKGQIDEVRLSTAVPSAAWVRLCYMNQRASVLKK